MIVAAATMHGMNRTIQRLDCRAQHPDLSPVEFLYDDLD